MTKALIDILVEEQELVREIDDVSRSIEEISDHRISVLMNYDDLTHTILSTYIRHLQTEIDRLNAEKFEFQAKLVGIRRELADYIKYSILKGE